ncbi:MAG: ATP-binding cassette domain-containing protein [Sedimentisphaerales bacterium]|nr:ATP-binding cassette domain-containing protein [Sedimentisphaerales bacterium]
MALLSINNISMGFGQAPILDNVSLQVEPGERICLIGRNGEGKTTLMKIIYGLLEPLSGQITRKPGLEIGMLEQTVPVELEGTVFQAVSDGLGRRGQLLQDYHDVSRLLAEEPTRQVMDKLNRLQHELETQDAWHVHLQVDTVISHLKLNADARVDTLSAGLKRRVLLARALVLEPDILLLDEPTNHLDVDSIVWLEEFLLKYPKTLIFVTHDRMFLRKLSTRIVNIDRGTLTSWQCDYDTFLKRRQNQLDAELSEQKLFDKKLAQEEAWIRTGIRARRTRNEGRVRQLLKMRQIRRQRRETVGKVRFAMHEAQTSGELVIDVQNVSFAYPDTASETPSPKIIDNLTTAIMRGDKIGIIGPNGSGKTTLLKVLLDLLKPTQGTVKLGTKLEISYFDQLHAQLNETKAVWENVADGYSVIMLNGKERNVIGYLQDFLFTPEQARNLVQNLSGGERNRLLLARLFAKPSNVLVLDEPTNDLDMETLELLEELLIDYKGTVLLVSHDRAFLNNVVTGTLVLEGQGRVSEFVGGYDDWKALQPSQEAQPVKKDKEKPPSEDKAATKKKLSYKQQKELDQIHVNIEQNEKELSELQGQMTQPSFYKQPSDVIAGVAARIQELETQNEQLFARWEQLEQ